MSAYFGPGGNSDAFRLAGFKSTLGAPAFVKNIGLDAYEYEAGNGLAASPTMLAAVGKAAKECGVKMSFHTPYFISLSGVVEDEVSVSSGGTIWSLHAQTKSKIAVKSTQESACRKSLCCFILFSFYSPDLKETKTELYTLRNSPSEGELQVS